MKTKNTLLFIVRLIAGGIIAYAGYQKLMDMETTISKMGSWLNLSAPVIWAVALGELLAGLGLIFGVFTRASALGAAIIMCGVFYYTNKLDPKAAAVLLGSVIVLISGAGSWTLTGRKASTSTTASATQPINPVPPSNNPQM